MSRLQKVKMTMVFIEASIWIALGVIMFGNAYEQGRRSRLDT